MININPSADIAMLIIGVAIGIVLGYVLARGMPLKQRKRPPLTSWQKMVPYPRSHRRAQRSTFEYVE